MAVRHSSTNYTQRHGDEVVRLSFEHENLP